MARHRVARACWFQRNLPAQGKAAQLSPLARATGDPQIPRPHDPRASAPPSVPHAAAAALPPELSLRGEKVPTQRKEGAAPPAPARRPPAARPPARSRLACAFRRIQAPHPGSAARRGREAGCAASNCSKMVRRTKACNTSREEAALCCAEGAPRGLGAAPRPREGNTPALTADCTSLRRRRVRQRRNAWTPCT